MILDEAYAEFQTHDDPDAGADLRRDFPNLVVLRTFSKAYGLAGMRVGYALCSPAFRAAVDAVRQPFSVNAVAQAAGAEAILHADDVAKRVESTIVERIVVEEGVRELGLRTPTRRRTSRGCCWATPTRARWSSTSPGKASWCAQARPSGAPATSGSPTARGGEPRFLEALGAVV